MKKKFYFPIFISAYLIFGCEGSEIVDVNIDYKEYVVARGELFADSIFTGVSFTKTLPLDETYEITKAEMKDVFAYLKINGVQVIPLHYTARGIYKPLYDIKIQAANTYELFAKVNGKSIYASTYVPEVPRINNAVFHSNEYVDVYIASRPNECYGSVFYVGFSQNNYSAKSSDFHSIVEALNTNFNDIVLSRTEEIPEQFRTPIYRAVTYIQVYSFDLAYSDYFKTRGSNQSISNSFIQGGEPIAWNVKGEKAIGLFVGMNKSRIETVKQ